MDGLVIKRGILQYVETELEKVIIPKHVRKVSSVAFRFRSKAVEILVEEENECFTSVDGVLYTKDMKTLVKYPPRKADKKFSIPEGVETIAECAFEHAMYLTKVTMPDSVTKIKGVYAFHNMKKLQSVRFSENLTTISPSMFSGCQKLKNVVLPEGIKKIESFAFSGCTSITKINLPQGVKYIGFNAFAGTALEKVTLPKRVNYVDPQAFFRSKIENIELEKGNRSFKSEDGVLYYCKDGNSLVSYPACKKDTEYSVSEGCNEICQVYSNNLEKLFIPASVENIWDDAFHQSPMLSEFVVDKNNEHYTTVDGVLFTKDMKTLVAYPVNKLDEEYVIPDGVERVENSAFLFCHKLLKLIMPESVKTIGKYAIFDCSVTEMNLAGEMEQDSICSFGLEKLTITNSVKEIKGFDGCNELEYVRIPETVEKICDYAFGSCEKLKTVIIESKDTEFEEYAFSNSKKVTIYAAKGSKAEAFAKEKGFKYKEITDFIIKGKVLKKYVGKDKVVVIPEGVATIEANAFEGRDEIEKIVLPTTLKEIKLFAFVHCFNLQEIVVAEGVVKFQGGFSFGFARKISIPSTLEELDEFAFSICDAEEINVHSENKHFKFENGCLYDYNGETLIKCFDTEIYEADKEMKGVKKFHPWAFSNCKKLTEVEIPEGVARIPENLFMFCETLEKVILPSTVESIGMGAFCDTKIKEIFLPEGVKEILDGAFGECDELEKVVLPDGAECKGDIFYGNCFVEIYCRENSKAHESVKKHMPMNKVKFL